MADAFARSRCALCGRGLGFDEWSEGGGLCVRCADGDGGHGPAAAYTRSPAIGTPAGRAAVTQEYVAYERMLDELPDELVEELIAALEAEAAITPARAAAGTSQVRELLTDIGFGSHSREGLWAAWGFAAGFAANVAIAKYAQVASGAPISQFVAPLLVGGVVAGAACGAIGWGLAKLREG